MLERITVLYSGSRFLIKNNCPKIFDESQKNLEITKKIFQGCPYTMVQIVTPRRKW